MDASVFIFRGQDSVSVSFDEDVKHKGPEEVVVECQVAFWHSAPKSIGLTSIIPLLKRREPLDP